MVLQGYWQSEVAPTMRAAILSDWADELEDWHVDQVRWALRSWRAENPSKRPNPGHILLLLKAERGRAMAAKVREMLKPPAGQDATPAPKMPPERAKELLAAAGFVPRRMDDAQ